MVSLSKLLPPLALVGALAMVPIATTAMAAAESDTQKELETVFMMTGEDHFYVSSQLVREIAMFGGKLTGLVPPRVEERLIAKFQKAPKA